MKTLIIIILFHNNNPKMRCDEDKTGEEALKMNQKTQHTHTRTHHMANRNQRKWKRDIVDYNDVGLIGE